MHRGVQWQGRECSLAGVVQWSEQGQCSCHFTSPAFLVLWCMLDSRQGTHQLGLHLQLPLAQQLSFLKEALLQRCRAPAACTGDPSACTVLLLPRGGRNTQGPTAADLIST